MLVVAGVVMLAGFAASVDTALRRTQTVTQADLVDGTILPGNADATLPISTAGSAILLTKVSTSGATTPAGRSYGGFPWEGVQPTVIAFDCSAVTECSAFLPAHDNPMTLDVDESQDSFRINLLAAPEPASDEEAAARFLLHGTFGPRKDEVTALASDPAGLPAAMQAWIDTQIAAPASLHREYVRRRSNTKWRIAGRNSANPVAGLNSPCQDGARYHPFAFTTDDEAKNLTVTPNAAGGFDMSIEGVVRTQVASFPLGVHPSQSSICETAATAADCSAAGDECAFDPVATPAVCTPPVGNPVRCAGENQQCDCPGGEIRFGAGTSWNVEPAGRVADSLACTNAIFGDPAPGVGKSCECSLPVATPNSPCSGVTALGNSTACAAASCAYTDAVGACAAADILPPAAGESTVVTICYVYEALGADIVLGTAPETCSGWANTIAGPVVSPNPPILFDSPPSNIITLTAADATMVSMGPDDEPDVFFLQGMDGTEGCAKPPPNTDAFLSFDGTYYMHDSRLALIANTVDQPATGPLQSEPTMSATCPSAPRTFLNKDTCVRRPECATMKWSDANVTLDDATIRTWFASTGKYIFAAVLDPDDPRSGLVSPCSRSWHGDTYSRWKQTPGACAADTALNADTLNSITAALNKGMNCYERHSHVWYNTLGNENIGGTAMECTPTTNPHFLDIRPEGACNDANAKGASITIGAVCWQQVPKNHMDVFDFSVLEAIEPTAIAFSTLFEENPIHALAMRGETMLDFSSLTTPAGILNNGDPNYSGTRYFGAIMGTQGSTANRRIWALPGDAPGTSDNHYHQMLALIGKYGDTINIADLPPYLVTPELGALVGSVGTAVYDGSEACGSPGEVANDPTLGNRIPLFAGMRYYTGGTPNYAHSAAMMDIRKGQAVSQRSNKILPFTKFSIDGQDQLRQRVAWALAQVFALGDVGGTIDITSELYTAFYDIFVRQAFGNFRDILKEISYNPLMGKWLTFKGSSAFATSGTYPDENFSREIMELFSIGLFNMNPDGTTMRDPTTGEPVPTYDNHDIMSFARIWTGFQGQPFRSNLENRENLVNQIDPMYIKVGDRDLNPKTDLFDNYIGEKKPLCVDLPPRSFLRSGATYVYSGFTKPKGPNPPVGNHWIEGWNNNNIGSVPLTTASPLYQTLCSPDAAGLCQWTSEITLDTNLACDTTECLVDILHSVEVISADGETVYYEYKPIECVTLPFYENATMIKTGKHGNRLMCANPLTPSAGASCCDDPTSTDTTSQARCQYAREKVTFATAQQRCAMDVQATSGYVNQYEAARNSGATEHMVAHGQNMFWHIYPQQGVNGGPCWLGCQTPENGGNPGYISRCKAPHENFEVRCCSDTFINASLGDNPNQAYVQNSQGQCSNSAFGHLGDSPEGPVRDGPMQTVTARPWANGHITNFAGLDNDPDNDDGCLHAKTFEEAEAACAADGARLCTQGEVEANCDYGSGCDGDNSFVWTSTPCASEPMAVCNRHTWVDGPDYCELQTDWTWMNRPCEIKIQVDVSGYIWMVHGGAREGGNGWNILDGDHPNYALDNLNVFRVVWNDADDTAVGGPGNYPHSGDDCSSSGCVKEGLTCLCTPDIDQVTVFTDSSTPPTKDQALELLHYGAVPVQIFDAGTYTQHSTSTVDVEVWTKGADYDADTIFKVNHNSRDIWLKNTDLTVTAGEFSFRAPPTHMDFVQPSQIQAEYETDALIDHIAEHPNTPLFICRLMILRFTTSNPSPRYLQVAAEAFKTGEYNGVTYTGKYGDMGAAMAAILLDREARSDDIEADPSHGKLREPLIKVLGLMRSMEYVSFDKHEISMQMLQTGQHPYKMPSVFNFYQPDFQPTGVVAENGLYSPEAQLLDPPKILGFLNGIMGLIDYGLDQCSSRMGGITQEGFGMVDSGGGGATSSFSTNWANRRDQYRPYDWCKTPNGELTYLPQNASTSTVAGLADIDMLLTGGRLNSYNKAYIQEKYDEAASYSGAITHVDHYNTTHMAAFGAALHQPSRCEPDHAPMAISCCSDIETNGYADRCNGGFAGKGSVFGKSPGCRRGATVQEAEEHCAADGGRLCTLEEIQGGCVYNTGCGFSWTHLWTSSRCPDNGPNAVKGALRAIVGTPEYSSTTAAPPKPGVRPVAPDIPFLNRGYKAVVVIWLYGGHDSWNYIVPMDNCPSKDLYAEYTTVRDIAAMPRNKLLPITVPAGTQPCGTFGVHHKAPNIKSFYDNGEVIFFANIGSLLAPITAEGYHAQTALVPFDLFSHLGQSRQAQSVHAQHTGAKGILGRMRDALSAQPSPFRANSYSVAGSSLVVAGKQKEVIIHKTRGVQTLQNYDRNAPAWLNMSHKESEGFFAETFAGLMESSLLMTNAYGDLLKSGGTAEAALSRGGRVFGSSSLSKQLLQVAKVTTIRNHPMVLSERDFFVAKFGKFDTHQSLTEVDGHTSELDNGIKEFREEMIAQGLWENITIVTASDFGRTLSTNGMGTDHAWAGHNTVVGGGLFGGQILGSYPENLLPGDGTAAGASLNIGRGRMIPTTPWEGVWHGVAQWLDIDDLAYVLPNLGSWNVGSSPSGVGILYTRAQMYADTEIEPEPMPEPEPLDLTTGTFNGMCLGVWRLITPVGQSVAIPTCVIPDPTVLPAGVTSYISLSGDIVSLISPNSPARQSFDSTFALDMAAAVGCDAAQVTVNAITEVAVATVGAIGGRRLQSNSSEISVDFTIWPDPTTGTPVEIAQVTQAFSAPGVSLGGLPSTTVITPESVHVYAANCGADKIADIGTKLASCCDATANGADCSTSVPSTCSTTCNTDMVPYWDDCSLTIAGMPATEFTFDVAAMETFVNGMCASGAGAATPPPPGAPPAAVSAPGIPGANTPPPPPPAPSPPPAPAPVVVPASAPVVPGNSTSPAVAVDTGLKSYHYVAMGAALFTVVFICKVAGGGGDEGKGKGKNFQSTDNPVAQD